MENKTAKEVTKKEVVKKQAIDFKALAEQIEDAFGKQDIVDVIADTNLPKGPKYTTLAEYRMVHFYKPGTDKDLFQLISTSKGATFIIRNNAAEYLDKSLTLKPAEKTVTVKGEKVKKVIHHLVLTETNFEVIVDAAKKIIQAYQSIPAKTEKVEKKTAEKPAKKQTTKKSATAKKKATA